MRKKLRVLFVSLGVVLLVAAAGFVAWGETPAKAMPEALAALQTDAQVRVAEAPWLVFAPADSQPTTGFIIYPGGRVDYRAYAPAARQIAAQGYLVVLVRMPLNLAVLDAAEAANIIAAYPQVQRWAIGGHSLGGAMAANFAKNHPDSIDGLVLWASYPASSDDLSGAELRVVSIYGTLDGLATGEQVDASRALLPAHTTWLPIEGGNHAQFGWYGDQNGDNPAIITREAQQAQIVVATLVLLEELK